MKEEFKIVKCIKCNGDIDIDKDNYIRLTEYLSGKWSREQFFHLNCYEEMFNIKKMALGMVGKVNKLMSMAGLPEDKVMEIKQ